MPIVEFFTSDPGLERLTGNTKINVIEQLAQAIRLAGGIGSVGMYGSVLNDRGIPNIPQRLAGPEDIKTLFGGFKSYLGDGVDFGSGNYDTKGSLSGYNGNLAAQIEGLDAPLITLTIPDFAIKDALFGGGSDDDVLVSFGRAGSTFGSFTLLAGFRISDGAGTPYVLATLEDVTWIDTDVSTKTVRARQISSSSVAPVVINTVTTLVDTPEDVLVVVDTVPSTLPIVIDLAEVILRYKKAFDESLSTAVGAIAELVVVDRTEAAVVDDLFIQASDASAQGHFRLAVGSPPIGTSATDAQGSGSNGVGRTTLLRTFGAFCHQGWNRQFASDSANLNAEAGFPTVMPSSFSYAFNAALFRPEENPAQFTANLTAYKIIGVEAISPLPARFAHEDAGITQPITEFANVGGLNASLVPSFHGAPLADGVLKFYTRRMLFFLLRNYLAIAAPSHKKLATLTNRTALLDAIDDFNEGLLEAERIGGFNPATGTYDPSLQHFQVNIAVKELGNIDVLTLRVTFGADVETSRNLEAA